ncbi:uncharacterized protein LOC18443980 [Amborella trichopoda]|nr:uncharacterized protein LOC18443980 [Amborella trichopoda]XP_020528903.1 uncharacterized protein LOC18443980 [Amborella trichopoda]XP_020528904.1 uncharacterized protein LOC18443980 [Amborella trichopoda]|eukprot:XP_011626977.1 uncharacterized protein LOC18443980 [Amborella trichopoda]
MESGTKMRTKPDGRISRTQNQMHGPCMGPNWVLIAGGALLGSLSIKLGHKLKLALEPKQTTDTSNKSKGEHGKPAVKKRSVVCPLHSNLYSFRQDDDSCCHCLSGNPNGTTDTKNPSQTSVPSVLKDVDPSLGPLVTVHDPTAASIDPNHREVGLPFQHSNSSGSPCVSESGSSDPFGRRDVIHRLRLQLKRRDDMILEMHAQISDQNKALEERLALVAHIQLQLESSNRELFRAEREIQKLRKVIADHCANRGSPDSCGSAGMVWPESGDVARIQCGGGVQNGFVGGKEEEKDLVDLGWGDEGEKVEILKRESGELREMIDGKDFLLESYREQKMELATKVKELQLRVASQIPNIL